MFNKKFQLLAIIIVMVSSCVSKPKNNVISLNPIIETNLYGFKYKLDTKISHVDSTLLISIIITSDSIDFKSEHQDLMGGFIDPLFSKVVFYDKEGFMIFNFIVNKRVIGYPYFANYFQDGVLKKQIADVTLGKDGLGQNMKVSYNFSLSPELSNRISTVKIVK